MFSKLSPIFSDVGNVLLIVNVLKQVFIFIVCQQLSGRSLTDFVQDGGDEGDRKSLLRYKDIEVSG